MNITWHIKCQDCLTIDAIFFFGFAFNSFESLPCFYVWGVDFQLTHSLTHSLWICIKVIWTTTLSIHGRLGRLKDLSRYYNTILTVSVFTFNLYLWGMHIRILTCKIQTPFSMTTWMNEWVSRKCLTPVSATFLPEMGYTHRTRLRNS